MKISCVVTAMMYGSVVSSDISWAENADDKTQICEVVMVDQAKEVLDAKQRELLRNQLMEVDRLTDSIASRAKQYVAEIKPDGHFEDIDYNSKQRSSWLAAKHALRLVDMAKYFKQGFADHEDSVERAACLDAIHRGLGYWLKHDFQSLNWWHNEIYLPRQLGTLLMWVGDEFSQQELEGILKISRRAKIGMTGQNTVMLAENVFYRGVWEADAALVNKALDAIFSEIRICNEMNQEGLQVDWSYHQHGSQQQFGNYGLAYLNSMMMWGNRLEGTVYELNDEQLAILRPFVLNGIGDVAYRGYFDINSCNRQLAKGAQLKKARALVRGVKSMYKLDSSYAKDYDVIIKSNDRGNLDLSVEKVGQNFFYRSDYLVHRGQGYMYSVKMCSTRVRGSEAMNGDNMSGYHLGDGVACLYEEGSEYEDIYAVWDWRKLPGITVVQKNEPMIELPWDGYTNGDSFVGGVSDNQVGVITMKYDRDDLTLNKSYFTLADRIVCIGSDIQFKGTLKDDHNIFTSIEFRNADANDDAYTKQLTADAQLFGHNKTGYLVLEQDAEGGVMTANGSWDRVRSFDSKDPVSQSTFQLGIDHANQTEVDRYQYVIWPRLSETGQYGMDNVQDLASNWRSQLINTNFAHALLAEQGQTLMAVLYKPQQIKLGIWQLKVDQPCVVMIRAGKLWIADPDQTLEAINVEINGKQYQISLPQDVYAGKTISVDL
ncbi:hypothetical protein JD969_13010 [Planctomycetota bacterium]|nr:hypothetical protein JD969_13010 [Planctomycetota bacterium]